MALTFENKMKVRDYECDSQGVVNNAIYLHYFEATRHELMEKCGLRLRDLTEANILPVVRNVNISYRNSSKSFDQFFLWPLNLCIDSKSDITHQLSLSPTILKLIPPYNRSPPMRYAELIGLQIPYFFLVFTCQFSKIDLPNY